MKPESINKIEAAANSGKKFKSLSKLADYAGVKYGTVKRYIGHFGNLNHAIVERPTVERRLEMLMAEANKGALTVVDCAQACGLQRNSSNELSRLYPELRQKVTDNHNEHWARYYDDIYDQVESRVMSGMGIAAACRDMKMTPTIYYKACGFMGRDKICKGDVPKPFTLPKNYRNLFLMGKLTGQSSKSA